MNKRHWLVVPSLVGLLACEPTRRDIEPGSNPQSGTVQMSRDGTKVYVLSIDHKAVLVFDRKSNQTVAEIAVGEGPSAMTVLADGRVAVTNQDEGTVSIVDTATSTEVNRIPVGVEPTAVVSYGGNVLVA